MAKYNRIAPLYDLLSAEHPVYGAGRRGLARLLDLQSGDQVLDIGCGTGLNFPWLSERVTSTGTVIGIDRSATMLAQARRRAQRNGWTNVILIQADATGLEPADISARTISAGGRALSDAALATYSLSLMGAWPCAWQSMWNLTTPRARLGILDMQKPHGAAAVFSPLAQLACRLGGSDINAHPWTALERDCAEVNSASARGGHLQVRVGSKPPAT
ncbi:class I SAM-dependent methyltransferase [Nesterenkonia haasae]|uniref:class I SAM-dependent methyltransferase n=1 Tax=Nesterenkonia haasae TaxID=2587813 RepID=UPI0013919177|nr:methyltransferase domain-containing protein [Nesterenkonia haasae]NDK33093.1 methyltransferase domain-containing protein [Nesterenkonia haasae]